MAIRFAANASRTAAWQSAWEAERIRLIHKAVCTVYGWTEASPLRPRARLRIGTLWLYLT